MLFNLLILCFYSAGLYGDKGILPAKLVLKDGMCITLIMFNQMHYKFAIYFGQFVYHQNSHLIEI